MAPRERRLRPACRSFALTFDRVVSIDGAMPDTNPPPELLALGITDDTPDATADAPDGDCPDDVLLNQHIAANFAEHQIWHRPLTAREIPVELKLPARDAAFERAMFDRVPGLGKFFGGNDDGSDRGTK